jgi:signal transduction histidine kinase
MTYFVGLLLLLCGGLTAACLVLYNRAVVAKRLREEQERAIATERVATASLIGLASEAVDSSSQESPFLDRYCDYARRTLQVSGAAVFLRSPKGFRGASVCGIFPLLVELPSPLREQLLSNPKHHRRQIVECLLPGDDPLLAAVCKTRRPQLCAAPFPSWIPAISQRGLGCLLVAPMTVRQQVIGLVMVVQDDTTPPLTEAQAAYLLRLGEIAALCLDGIRLTSERYEQEQRLRDAQEQGMRQITSGLVHNVGNAVTVAQFLAHDLLTATHAEEQRLLAFVVQDVLPTLAQHQAGGDLAAFLQDDPQGREYLTSLAELLSHLGALHETHQEKLHALDQKLLGIIQIIELQQRFLGPLGTEEELTVDEVARHAITIIGETAQCHQVELVTEFAPTPPLLADRTMLTQVILNLLANAINAFEPHHTARRIVLRTYAQRRQETPYAVCQIQDNGRGIPPDTLRVIFDVPATATAASAGAAPGSGLGFCRQTLAKYAGLLEVESTVGSGTSFYVCLKTSPTPAAAEPAVGASATT